MSKAFELNADEFALAFKMRRRMRLVWWILLGVSELLFAGRLIVEVIGGSGPSWWTVLGAAWVLPVLSWMHDDYLRRKLAKSRPEIPA